MGEVGRGEGKGGKKQKREECETQAHLRVLQLEPPRRCPGLCEGCGRRMAGDMGPGWDPILAQPCPSVSFAGLAMKTTPT